MHSVIRTATFLSDARAAGLSENDQQLIVVAISENPELGDVMPGTGGCRKVRFAGKGKSKHGGYRTVHYFAADDVPVVLLALISKGERSDHEQLGKTTYPVCQASACDRSRRGRCA
jgi:mRNA-degrading endonuclease RelE of RelBE toxin-antitoxin system